MYLNKKGNVKEHKRERSNKTDVLISWASEKKIFA